MYNVNIGDFIQVDNYNFNKDLMIEWNRIKLLLMTKYVVTTKTITPLNAEKYRFDLWGLFRDIIQIPETYIYPHIICNGYDSSQCYDGGRLTFDILDNPTLMKYHRVFVRNIESKQLT